MQDLTPDHVPRGIALGLRDRGLGGSGLGFGLVAVAALLGYARYCGLLVVVRGGRERHTVDQEAAAYITRVHHAAGAE